VYGNGEFALSGVTPGSYWLIAEVVEDRNRLTARIPVDVGNGNLDDLTLTLAAGVELSGAVRGPEAANLKSATIRVQLEPRGGNIVVTGTASGAVREDGTFSVQNVTPDAYNVRVYGLPEGCYVQSVRFGDSDITDAGLDLSQSAAAGQLAVTVATGAGQVNGSVENDKQQPASGVWVIAVPEGARREHQQYYGLANTDQTGHYTLKGLVPGDYRVYAFDQMEAGAYQDSEFMKPFESKGEKLHVEENGNLTQQLKLIPTSE
jgi:hypothetical protein